MLLPSAPGEYRAFTDALGAVGGRDLGDEALAMDYIREVRTPGFRMANALIMLGFSLVLLLGSFLAGQVAFFGPLCSVGLIYVGTLARGRAPLVRRAKKWCAAHDAAFVTAAIGCQVISNGDGVQYDHGWLTIEGARLMYIPDGWAPEGPTVISLPGDLPLSAVVDRGSNMAHATCIRYTVGEGEKEVRVYPIPRTGNYLRDVSHKELDMILAALAQS
ncbi:hypothetical protein [Microbacterium gorillae]|uniref:hypothetical protein n=1 Tax=Microbacterium gorillae TaxID=1231063 RepID=UPI003D9928FC